MTIAITATGKDMSSNVDPRFGRAKYFIVVDTDTNEAAAHDNTQNLNAAQGAGIQAGETVARLGAAAVITGNVGPKAFAALRAGGISVFIGAGGSVRETIDQLKAGRLKQAEKPTAESHWV